MSDEYELNKKVNDMDVRISHRNLLWYIYRALAEEMVLSQEAEVKCCQKVISSDICQE